MDAKNRVTVPSDWLGQEGDVFFVLPAKEKLSVMQAEELARYEQTIVAMIPAGAERQDMIRRIYSSARQVEADKQGRILLPDEYCKRADLSGEVAFVGVKHKFEIWSAAKRSNEAQKEPAYTAEQLKVLAELGLEQ